MKKFGAIIGITMFIFTASLFGYGVNASKQEQDNDTIAFYDQVIEEEGLTVEVVDSSRLTHEMIENRDGKLLIEKCIGVVENSDTGDGRILNTPEGVGNYISYRRVDGVKDGAVVLTYFIYDPHNNYVDGIVDRFDYVIEK